MRKNNEIEDNELRVIGGHGSTQSGRRSDWIPWATAAFAAVLLIAVVGIFIVKSRRIDTPDTVYEPETSGINAGSSAPVSVKTPFGNYADTTKAYTEHIKKEINDIPLHIYVPHNAVPTLSIGMPDMYDTNIVFVTQAADIRADNGKINGAFVLNGEPKAWGLSKKGFVAIIDGKVTIGVSENSPLFEEATEKGGYFFRQYALVNNGVLVENEPKGKSIRKSICDRAGEIFMVFSAGPESFHDFSQALVDLGVDNAVYLVGSEYSYGYYRDNVDHFVPLAEKWRGGQKFENYIRWSKW